MPETEQPFQPDATAKNAEELDVVEISPDRNPEKEPEQSDPAKALENEKKVKKVRQENNDLVLNWLIKNIGIAESEEFYQKFKDILEKENGQDTKGMDQVAEFLRGLKELFKQVDTKIEELGKDETNYKNIGQKRVEIIKAICEPILEGHITGSDAEALVSGIEIVNINDPEKQKLFEDVGVRSGYEGVAFYDTKEHKIYIFDKTLGDKYPGFDELDIKHLMTHEMSHGIVESAVKYNKTLVAEARKIIRNAKALVSIFADSQSQHIRHSLEGVTNADTDFAKRFADDLSKEPAYAALSDEQKAQYEEAEKIKFVKDREIQAAAEILTEYTAMYLQSDGSIEDFVLTCLQKSDPQAIKSYLGKEFSLQRINAINKITNPEKKQTLLKDLGEGFSELSATYRVFYDEIKSVMTSSKGKFAELTAGENDDDDPFGEFSYGGYMDGPAGFAGQQQEGRTGNEGGSLWSEVGALIKAMSEEVPNVK